VWKSCVVDGLLMEEEVEELAPRLPYPLKETLEMMSVRGARRQEGEKKGRARGFASSHRKR